MVGLGPDRLVSEAQHLGVGPRVACAACLRCLPLTRSHGLVSSSGPGAPAALGKPGCVAGGLLAGAESARVRLHQGPRPAPLQVRDPHFSWWLLLGVLTGTPGGVVLPEPLKARGLSWGTGWSGEMKPLETFLYSPHQAVPRVRDLFLLHSWALGGRRARDKRWHRASGGLVATD